MCELLHTSLVAGALNVGRSGGLPPPSPPAEKATTSKSKPFSQTAREGKRPQPKARASPSARWKRGIIAHCMNDPQPEGHLASYIGRRKFLATLGGAAAWPLAARAQQPAMPVIGFLSGVSPDANVDRVSAFRKGLKETGYLEGENVAIEYRWAEGRYGRLPELAAELVHRQVAVIAATGGDLAALAAKAATTRIPIVFGVSEDPVRLGLVASLARTGGNATGVNLFVGELGSKQLGLLHELVPAASRIGLLVNPNVSGVERATKDVSAAALTFGLQIEVVQASDSREIESAFEELVRNRSRRASGRP